MRVFCNGSRRNVGAWVAVSVGVLSATHSSHPGHHFSGWWWAGLAVGMLVTAGIGLVLRRRCA